MQAVLDLVGVVLPQHTEGAGAGGAVVGDQEAPVPEDPRAASGQLRSGRVDALGPDDRVGWISWIGWIGWIGWVESRHGNRRAGVGRHQVGAVARPRCDRPSRLVTPASATAATAAVPANANINRRGRDPPTAVMGTP